MLPLVELPATTRIRLIPPRDQDLERVALLFGELEPVLLWLGPRRPIREIALELIEKRELPPEGNPDRALTALIQDPADSCLLGVLEYYCGYPEEDCLYIGSLFLSPRCQGKGYGSEIETAIAQAALERGYRWIYLAVGILNWPALRFWTGRGFTEITFVSGDEAFGPGKFAVIELRRPIAGTPDWSPTGGGLRVA